MKLRSIEGVAEPSVLSEGEENEEPKEENIEDWEAQTAELEKDNTKTETE